MVAAGEYCGYSSQWLAYNAAYIEVMSQAQNQANNTGSCLYCGDEYNLLSCPENAYCSECGGIYKFERALTCADEGYEDSIPAYQICSSTSYAGLTCYYDCRLPNEPFNDNQRVRVYYKPDSYVDDTVYGHRMRNSFAASICWIGGDILLLDDHPAVPRQFRLNGQGVVVIYTSMTTTNDGTNTIIHFEDGSLPGYGGPLYLYDDTSGTLIKLLVTR
jgi:hypothetical protein